MEEGYEVFVLDREAYLGEHTSGRNSGVVHAGVFYETGSFKEKICIEGNALTYEWLKRLKVPHRACGKWIVPEEGQENDLDPFFERVRKLPIPTPVMKSHEAVAEEEPRLRRTRALFIPSTGILDAASYLKSMQRYLEEKGVQIILPCKVERVGENFLKTSRGRIDFDLAINCAGLFADEIARQAGEEGYEIRPCRGDYYTISRRNLLKRPVYHLPYRGSHGLGVHLTPVFEGSLLIGPNAFFIENKTDYHHRTPTTDYERAVRYFLPSCAQEDIVPAYSGNRPKLFVNGRPCSEFAIFRRRNWIHLLGIESPGLTAAPALARYVVE